MKPRSTLFLLTAFSFAVISATTVTAQQNYKLRQTTSMMGMKSETTIYVKPMRKRTEGGGYMGQTNNLVTIEQCDKQRMITLNTKKKLYFIEPFGNDNEEVIDEDAKPVAKTKPATPVVNKDGGIIYNYYSITDTGERKKMHGFTARHIWTTQKMKPSADACYMKDSMVIKTDGWYIDLPEFNCPIRYKPTAASYGGQQKPNCKDKYVTRRSGKGKLGFALIEKRTMIMGGQTTTSEFVTDLETLELVTGKQDSMLFEIPPGYAEAKSVDELQDKFDMAGMADQYKKDDNKTENEMLEKAVTSVEKRPGVIRIGVYEPKGEGISQPDNLQKHIVGIMMADKVECVSADSEEDARSKKCDYTLSTDLVKMKQASKVGGLLKAIKNTDPNAATSFNIEASMVLISLADGSVRSQQNITGKFDGKPDEAAKRASEEGVQKILKDLR